MQKVGNPISSLLDVQNNYCSFLP